MLTKQEILRWYLTSILPSDGTEELNLFMLAISRRWNVQIQRLVGAVAYTNVNAAQKAFDRYGFTESDLIKMNLPVPKTDIPSLKLKELRK